MAVSPDRPSRENELVALLAVLEGREGQVNGNTHGVAQAIPDTFAEVRAGSRRRPHPKSTTAYPIEEKRAAAGGLTERIAGEALETSTFGLRAQCTSPRCCRTIARIADFKIAGIEAHRRTNSTRSGSNAALFAAPFAKSRDSAENSRVVRSLS